VNEADDGENTLVRLGGPGWLEITLGNAVVLERGPQPTAVLGTGRHYLRRFEWVRRVVDLRETYRQREAVEAVTKDGIPVVIRNVEATFKLYSRPSRQRHLGDPYPYKTEALYAAIYAVPTADAHGAISDWADDIMDEIVRRIRRWVEQQQLDRLTAPEIMDPRQALRDAFAAPQTRAWLRERGAELIWLNIGHFDTPEAVDNQRAETWRSFWRSEALLTRVQAKAMNVSYEELGYAEGQAEMIMAITDALNTVEPSMGALDERLAELALMRVGQVIQRIARRDSLLTVTAVEPAARPEPAELATSSRRP
jgi:hypothetical protein